MTATRQTVRHKLQFTFSEGCQHDGEDQTVATDYKLCTNDWMGTYARRIDAEVETIFVASHEREEVTDAVVLEFGGQLRTSPRRIGNRILEWKIQQIKISRS